MTASEYPLLAALMAPPPSTHGMVQVAVDPASPVGAGLAVQFVVVAMVLPRAPASARQRVDLLRSYPATAAH